MKHLKSYNEEFNLKNLFNNKDKKLHRKIHSICKEYGIENYTINSDGSIDVNGNVDFHYSRRIDEIPLKFKNVTGNFRCRSNRLTSLQGCPESVGGIFDCGYNLLTSLDGCPESVGGHFYCTRNQLTSLEGCPSSVGGDFDCGTNQLTSLEGCPKYIKGYFNCGENQLTSLVGCPEYVSSDFYCTTNDITSFEGCPKSVKVFYCGDNPIDRIWDLFEDYSKMEFFNDCDIIRDDKVIILDRLNYFLEEIGKPIVKSVKEYECI